MEEKENPPHPIIPNTNCVPHHTSGDTHIKRANDAFGNRSNFSDTLCDSITNRHDIEKQSVGSDNKIDGIGNEAQMDRFATSIEGGGGSTSEKEVIVQNYRICSDNNFRRIKDIIPENNQTLPNIHSNVERNNQLSHEVDSENKNIMKVILVVEIIFFMTILASVVVMTITAIDRVK